MKARLLTPAVRRAHLRWPGRTVEVECDTRAQVEAAVAAGADLDAERELARLERQEAAAKQQLDELARDAERRKRFGVI